MKEITKLRARRFPIYEESKGTGKMNKEHENAMPNARWYPGGDAYFHYRTMVAVASLPDRPPENAYGPIADQPFSTAYTKEEDDMISMAAKLCGYPGKRLSNGKSTENDDVHKHSPTNHNAGKHPIF